MNNTYLHIIDVDTDVEITRRLVSYVPRVGDEIRIGGKENEKYYKITIVVWVYDEDSSFERVNIGVTRVAV